MAKEGVLNLVKDGIPADKLAKVVENLKKNIPEQRINNGYWMSVLTTWENDKYDYDKEYEEAVAQISAENILSVLQKVVNSGNFVEIMMSPAK